MPRNLAGDVENAGSTPSYGECGRQGRRERAIELAGELSAASGAVGEPIHEWLEVRPFLTAPPTVTQ